MKTKVCLDDLEVQLQGLSIVLRAYDEIKCPGCLFAVLINAATTAAPALLVGATTDKEKEVVTEKNIVNYFSAELREVFAAHNALDELIKTIGGVSSDSNHECDKSKGKFH